MWLLAACVGALIGSGASAAAAATPAFDQVLSLTGNCSESSLDPVPDPGLCPMPPGSPGVDHPTFPFVRPSAVTTDDFGNIYVASTGLVEGPESEDEGSIDIFSSAGEFLTEVPERRGPTNLAVDSKGNLYVASLRGDENKEAVVLYEPTSYEPAEGKIEYSSIPTAAVVEIAESFNITGLAVNRIDDNLFVKFSDHVSRYKSAGEGNELIESFGFGLVAGVSTDSVGVAVDATHGRLYISGQNVSECPCVYALELAPPHKQLFKLTGAAVPKGKFIERLSLAADEATGDLYVYDGEAHSVYRFETSNSGANYNLTGEFAEKGIQHGFQYTLGAEIGLDNGAQSPNAGYLYVPSEAGGKGGATGHSYAFGPAKIDSPEVETISFANVGKEEAELRAEIEPFGLPTNYTFEYITAQKFEEQGDNFVGAQIAGGGEIPAGSTPASVTAGATGLQPGVAYRFRVVATNAEGVDEEEGEFATYPAAESFLPCPNDPVRGGSSALLPDCRAYELVTPPDTNARPPRGTNSTLGAFFPSPQSSLGGGEVSFELEGGSLPGAEAVGSLAGDPYLSSRGEGGWSTAYAGPSGAEASKMLPGSTSPDQRFSLWVAEGEGTAVIEAGDTNYVRYPDGHSALVGRGSEGTDPRAQPRLISENGGHIIFLSSMKLESDAPPGGTAAIYDRTPDEVTHVISLLPGGETPGGGEQADYVGTSLDGRGVGFEIGSTLYFRYNSEKTYELGEGVTFAGITEGGARAFYLEGGNLYRFDAQSQETTPFSTSGNVIPVNVSADGSVAYFASPSVLTGEENPNGDKAVAGKENLYRSEEGEISFVGTVTERDVEGELKNNNQQLGGLGLWTIAVGPSKFGPPGRYVIDPSRITPSGKALLFESRAPLDGYDPEGHAEVYRYDFAGDELNCLSCNPTLAPAKEEASLQSDGTEFLDPEPLGLFALIDNLTANGRRAFFQSAEALVPADNDGLQDVYEWEAEGVGSCKRPDGCLYLISSGHSEQIDYLFAVSDEGNDAFFRSGDILVPSDLEETPSIYDARVDGGFPEPESLICEGEGCRPGLTPAPGSPSLASRGGGPSGNVRKPKCPKGKHQVRRHGRVRCVKKHQKRRHHRNAGTAKKGASK